MVKTILLSNGGCTVVSDEDFIFLVGYNWCLSGGYVRGRINSSMQYMHRVIAERAGIDCSNHIDHINGNKLDNRRENLRAATHGQNLANSKSNTSGLKGVEQFPSGRWRSQIRTNGQRIHLGVFDTEEEAHQAYCDAAEYYHGEFANSGETK